MHRARHARSLARSRALRRVGRGAPRLVPHRSGCDRLRSSRRSHTRLLATGGGAPRSSVDRRITMIVRAISTTYRRSTTLPCNLSRAETHPPSLRCALPSPRGQTVHQSVKFIPAGYEYLVAMKMPGWANDLRPVPWARQRAAQRGELGPAARYIARPGGRASVGRGDGTAGHRDTAVNGRDSAAGSRPPPWTKNDDAGATRSGATRAGSRAR
jgi:hypothetical protein